MCIIIDADVSHQISPPTDAARPVIDWVLSGRGRVVTGGRNARELGRNGTLARWLVTLKRAGRLREIDTAKIDAELVVVGQIGCVSNDPHIIALARASGSRLVFSNDAALHQDIRNPSLLAKPRAHIYQNESHRRLLRNDACV